MAAKNIAPERTIYQIIKSFKNRGFTAAKKAFGHPRVSSKCQGLLFLRNQLGNHVVTCAEVLKIGSRWCDATARSRLLDNNLVSRRAENNPLFSNKNIKY